MALDDPAARTALDEARPGERWVLRVREPDGSATDLIGWLEGVDADAARLWRAGTGVTVVPRGTVLLARRAPAPAGGPSPARTSAADLQRVALPGWMALAEPLGEWVLRAGGGFTRRANSCLAVGDPGMPAADAAAAVVAHADGHGIEPRAQVVVGSAEEAALTGLGWAPDGGPTDVLAARLADVLGTALPDPDVTVRTALDPAWWDAYAESRPGEVDPGLRRLVLAGRPPLGFARVDGERGLDAIGRGHLQDGWLGLTAVWTRPERRRRGLAVAVVGALGHWAARAGARSAHLAVESSNPAGQALWRGLGFAPHHAYRYLRPPAGERRPGSGQTQRTRSVGA